MNFLKKKKNYIDAICSLGEKGAVINKSQFSIMTLQREACSSREAVYYTLKNMLQKEELATPTYHQEIQKLISPS